MDSTLFQLTQVCKSYVSGDHQLAILKTLNLAVASGKSVAITGPSGSGKSTLLSVMAGLDQVDSGQVLFEAKRLDHLSQDALAAWRKANVGFIFQDFRLIKRFTALENVSIPLEIAGQSADNARRSAENFLEQMGLSERIHHFPQQLSGGEQQRVAIARAYVHTPKLIFADEPTGNLDRETAASVFEQLLALNRQNGTTLILVTHDLDLAQRVDRHVKMENGTVVEVTK